MNHLGDANKMVSDTPMTDAHIDGLRRDPEVSGCDRTLNFCRQLERELNAANERIKRLEEAGDMMEKLLPEGSICDKAAIRWTKAREAKL